jgi:hypothetical protein
MKGNAMTDPVYHIADIMEEKDECALTIFNPDGIAWVESRLVEKRGCSYVKCIIRERASAHTTNNAQLI